MSFHDAMISMIISVFYSVLKLSPQTTGELSYPHQQRPQEAGNANSGHWRFARFYSLLPGNKKKKKHFSQHAS